MIRRTCVAGIALLAALAAAGCGDIHPVYWTRTARAASRGDVDGIVRQAERDPYAGEYVREYLGD